MGKVLLLTLNFISIFIYIICVDIIAPFLLLDAREVENSSVAL